MSTALGNRLPPADDEAAYIQAVRDNGGSANHYRQVVQLRRMAIDPAVTKRSQHMYGMLATLLVMHDNDIIWLTDMPDAVSLFEDIFGSLFAEVSDGKDT